MIYRRTLRSTPATEDLDWILDGQEMAPQTGFEPVTLRLTAGCSTVELLRSEGEMNAPGGARNRCYFYISARAMRSKWRCGKSALTIFLRSEERKNATAFFRTRGFGNL